MARQLTLLLLLCLLLFATHPAQAQDDTSWLVQQINALRGGLGLAGYVLNAQLTAAATQHSQYIATTCDISHSESNGSTPASRAAANGYTGDHVSENIYGGSNAKASDAWTFWINSPVHYAGLVHGLINEVGVGIAHGPCGHYYTLLFGHRADVSAPPAPAAAAAAGQPAAEAPTQKPYVPPPPSRTPTATIPTFTPSPTWTLTPTRNPANTVDAGEADAATAAAIVQQTALAYEVGAVSSATTTTESPTRTTTPTPTQELTQTFTPSATPTITVTPTLLPVEPPDAESSDDFEVRDLLPFALLGQAILIGLVGISFFRRAR